MILRLLTILITPFILGSVVFFAGTKDLRENSASVVKTINNADTIWTSDTLTKDELNKLAASYEGMGENSEYGIENKEDTQVLTNDHAVYFQNEDGTTYTTDKNSEYGIENKETTNETLTLNYITGLFNAFKDSITSTIDEKVKKAIEENTPKIEPYFSPGIVYSSPVFYNPAPLPNTNKIDQLTNTTITNPTITGGSISGTNISGITVSSVDGVFSGDISAVNGDFSGYVNTNEGYYMNDGPILQASSTTYNLFVGPGVGTSTTSGIKNTFIGYQSGQANSTGSFNVGNGYRSLYSNTTGGSNVAFGPDVLLYNTTGSNNTAVGLYSLRENSLGNNNVAFGDYTLNNTGNNTNYNVAIGSGAMLSSNNVSYNVAIGSGALNGGEYGGYVVGHILTTNANIAVGYQSLFHSISGNNNALGYQSMYSNVSGDKNSTFGYKTLYSNISGSDNSAFGYESMYSGTTNASSTAQGVRSIYNGGSFNTAQGYEAIYQGGNYNTAQGAYALRGSVNLGSSANTAQGYRALGNLFYGNNNVAIGYETGLGISTAGYGSSNNIFIGYKAADNLTTGSNNLILGYDIDAPSATGSNQLNIGNLIFGTNINGTGTTVSSGNIGIGTTTPWARLSVNGKVALPALSNNSTGYYACINTTTGELATSTTACGASSERYKTNIEQLTYGLDTIEQLNPVSFDWKEDFIKNGTKQIGLIAEQVNPIIPEVVGKNPDGQIMNLDYPKLTVILINAVKELSQKITDLSTQIANLSSNTISTVSEWVGEKVTATVGIFSRVRVEMTEFVDQKTGDIYCVTIENGEWVKTKGECTIVTVGNSNNNDQITTDENATTTTDYSLLTTNLNIILLGNNPAEIELGATYIDLGATASTSNGTTLMPDMIENNVDTSKVGEYEVVWIVHDENLNYASTTRSVIVFDPYANNGGEETVVEDNGTTTISVDLNHGTTTATSTDENAE